MKILSKIDVQNVTAVRRRLDHVGVRVIVAADGEASGRCMFCLGGTDLAGDFLDVSRLAQVALRENRQDGDRSAEVVRHQQVFPGRMNAHVGRAGSAGRHHVQELQLAVRGVDGKRADGSGFRLADPSSFVSGIDRRSPLIHRQATGTGPHPYDPGRSQFSRTAIDLEQMDAAAVPRRQIDLRRQDVFKRRAERSDVRHERTLSRLGFSADGSGKQSNGARDSSGGSEKRTTGKIEACHGATFCGFNGTRKAAKRNAGSD
jgi:hypothetical protein